MQYPPGIHGAEEIKGKERYQARMVGTSKRAPPMQRHEERLCGHVLISGALFRPLLNQPQPPHSGVFIKKRLTLLLYASVA